MHLKILLPHAVFADEANVARIVVDTCAGSFGLLPHRLDCVTELVPGILFFQTEGAEEVCVAVDEGVLVKTGSEVLVSVRRAIGGKNLSQLKQLVAKQYLTVTEQEKAVRSVMAKMETGLLRRLAGLQA